MKKRLFSIALACAISLVFASGAYAAVLPPSFPASDMSPAKPSPSYPTYPSYPNGTIIPGTDMTPATPVNPSNPSYIPGTVMTPATPVNPSSPNWYIPGTYIPGTVMTPATPVKPGTVVPATPLYPASPATTLKPNPLPSGAKPLPTPNSYGYNYGYGYGAHAYDNTIQADIYEMISALAAKHNANAKSIYRYVYISDDSWSKLSSSEKKQMKQLMLKMAAKELGISVSKLEKELKGFEDEMVKRQMARSSMSKSKAKSYVREHAHNTLFNVA